MKTFIALSFFICSIRCFSQEDTAFSVKYFSTLPHISIRAIEAKSDRKMWFAANHGIWGYTEDGGESWHLDSIKADTIYPEFRSMAVLNDSTALLLSISSPAYLFKTTNKGRSWKQVYKNTHKDIFFDSMKFLDEEQGVAVGDPIDGCFQIITTQDGGTTWKQTDCSNIPKAAEGEALFASSNTNINISYQSISFVTGGSKARLFSSLDDGKHFDDVFNTPITHGGKLSGIFSFQFLSEEVGIIAGGNYERTDSTITGLAITRDGGQTWKELKSQRPFFGSCVQFQSGNTLFVTGHDGTFIGSGTKINEVKDESGHSLKFNTLRISPSKKAVWLAGDKGRIAFITFAQ